LGYLFQSSALTYNIHTLTKNQKMKNSFKLGVLALAIAVSFVACKGNGAAGSKDSDTTKKVVVDTTKKVVIDSSKKVVVDTTKKDTTKKK
jgi:hypothetical protein